MKKINHALIQEVGKRHGLIEVFRGDPFPFSTTHSAMKDQNKGFSCVFLSVTKLFLFACFRIEDQKLVSGRLGILVDGFDTELPHAFTVFQLSKHPQYLITYNLHPFTSRRGAKEEYLHAVLNIMESMKGELLRMDVNYPFCHPDEGSSCTTASRIDAMFGQVVCFRIKYFINPLPIMPHCQNLPCSSGQRPYPSMIPYH